MKDSQSGLLDHRGISFSLPRIYIARVLITNKRGHKIFDYIIKNKRKPSIPIQFCSLFVLHAEHDIMVLFVKRILYRIKIILPTAEKAFNLF